MNIYKKKKKINSQKKIKRRKKKARHEKWETNTDIIYQP